MYLESSTWAAGCCSCCIWNLLLPSSKLMWVSALYVSFGFSYHRPSLLFTLMLIPIWLYASNCCMRRLMATASCPRCWVDVAGLHITFQVIIVNAGMEPIASFPHRTSFGIRSFSIRLTSTKHLRRQWLSKASMLDTRFHLCQNVIVRGKGHVSWCRAFF